MFGTVTLILSISISPSSAFMPISRGTITHVPLAPLLKSTIVERESNTSNNSSTVYARVEATNLDQNLNVTIASIVEANGDAINMTNREVQILHEMEAQASELVDQMMDESCAVDPETGSPIDELCIDEEKRRGFRTTLKGYVKAIGSSLWSGTFADSGDTLPAGTPKERLTGDMLEKGCEFFTEYL